ncbi:MAG: hypothetical protein HY347_07630 [candidate division NC10 bacterium]|nr:hypothetical protein [candidate division NC10 bacterium]
MPATIDQLIINSPYEEPSSYPAFLIRLTSGTTLVLEVKGQDSQQDRTKREFLDEWVRAVNQHGGFGRWAWDVSRDPSDIGGLLEKHMGS